MSPFWLRTSKQLFTDANEDAQLLQVMLCPICNLPTFCKCEAMTPCTTCAVLGSKHANILNSKHWLRCSEHKNLQSADVIAVASHFQHLNTDAHADAQHLQIMLCPFCNAPTHCKCTACAPCKTCTVPGRKRSNIQNTNLQRTGDSRVQMHLQ